MEMEEQHLANLVEVELNLRFEKNRLKTFENWKDDFQNKHKLAMMGFYFSNPDEIKCYFCNFDLTKLNPGPGDNVFLLHLHYSGTKCWTSNEIQNVPLDSAKFKKKCLNIRTTQCSICETDIYWLENPDGFVKVHKTKNYQDRWNLETYNIDPDDYTDQSKPCKHPKFAQYENRIKTYDLFHLNSRKDFHELSMAGFFYTDSEDKVVCFYCSGSIAGWKLGDCPLEVHAKYFSYCAFIKYKLGKDIFKYVQAKYNKDYIDLSKK